MKWIKHPLTIRRKNRLFAVAALREERTVSRMFWPIWLPVFVSFSVVDSLSTSFSDFAAFFGFRVTLGLLSYVLYIFGRGRIKHNSRAWMIPSTFVVGVQIIMLKYDLLFSPYYGGLALVLFGGVTYFPRSAKWAFVLSSITLSPTLIALVVNYKNNPQYSLIGIAMTLGTIMTAALFSDRVRRFLFESLEAEIILRESLRNREQEVRDAAEKLVRKKRFESQFSPQIVHEVSRDPDRFNSLETAIITAVFCDVVGSTQKAREISTARYSECLKEVFDLIASVFLGLNLTLDKFTGDGVLAFSGSPKSKPDDFARATRACWQAQQRIEGKRDGLRKLWGDDLQLRFGICEGEALVGFFGGGAIRSFTAIGTCVSLADRLCKAAPVGSIIAFSERRRDFAEDIDASLFVKSKFQVSGLKGYENVDIHGLQLTPRQASHAQREDIGRCKECASPLLVEETASGYPKVICPICDLSQKENILRLEQRTKKRS
jgi:adenylate cyclase